ncbi:MAG: hypothetical protein JSU85_03575 [Candidatus Zixiibacteriota bacterium]|nr:MAG: hypothetical protein JSU85_03575 [candidate division Zixibacteria bacterium]
MFKREKILGIIGLCVLILLLSGGIAWGRGISNARALGMGGSYTAIARGIDAPYWNPANLGLSDGNRYSIGIFGVGAALKKNIFTLADYNKYNGQFLTDGDKENILNSIPADGLRLDAIGEASALNFSVGNFALVSKGYGASSLNIDRDPLELIFYGNAVVDEISLDNTYGEGYGIADIAASYGHPVMQWENGEFAVGGSFHYLRGFAYQKVIESEGSISTTDTGFVGDAHMTILSSLGGSGYALDLGLAVKFDRTWYFSAAWQNAYSRMIWDKDTEMMIYTFNMEPITAYDFSDSAASDSLITSSDTTVAADPFSSDLPSTMRLGLTKEFNQFLFSFDWEQALETRPGTGVNPRLAAGLEYKPLNFLPLRAGMSTGGRQGSLYSFGFGLHFGPYHFDIAVANSGSPFPTHTKGARFALGMGLYF